MERKETLSLDMRMGLSMAVRRVCSSGGVRIGRIVDDLSDEALEEVGTREPVSAARSLVFRPDVLEKVVCVSDDAADEVCRGDPAVDDDGEGDEDDGEPGGGKGEEAEKGHFDGRLPARPEVGEGEGERGGEEGVGREWAQEQETGPHDAHHPRKLDGAPGVGLLEHARVPRHEEEVKEKVDGEVSEKQKGRQKPPVLRLLHGRVPGEEELKGRHEVALHQQTQEERRQSVVARDWRDLKEPRLEREAVH